MAISEGESSSRSQANNSGASIVSTEAGLSSETTPLLTHLRNHEASIEPVQDRSGAKLSPLTAQLVLGAVLMTVTCAEALADSPTTRIAESIICYKYYEQVDPTKLLTDRNGAGPGALLGVDEAWCKADAIQGEVAMIRSYLLFLDGFPSLLLAIPFGWAADKFGRRPFIILALVAFLLRDICIQVVMWFWQTFDIRLIWLSSLHGLLFGGGPVVVGLFYTMLSDVTPEAELATTFLRLGAAGLLSTLIMPPVSAWLMNYNPWIPSIGGTLINLLGLFLIFAVPETLGFRHASSTGTTSPVLEDALITVPDITPMPEPVSASLAEQMLFKSREVTSFLWRDWRVPVLMVPFFAHILIMSATQLLLQYISKRHGLTISDATLLVTIRAGVNVALLFFILPYISSLLMERWHLSGKRKDLYLSRASLLLTAVGWTLVAASPNVTTMAASLAIASLGTGGMTLVRSFLTSLVPAHHIARTYSLISIIDTLGSMFGAPLLATLFEVGMKFGPSLTGLPFYFLGIISAAFTVLLFVVRLQKNEERKTQDEDSDM